MAELMGNRDLLLPPAILGLSLQQKKNSTQPKSCEILIYLCGDLTEGYSPGNSLSASSEGLFQRGKGGARIYRNFC